MLPSNFRGKWCPVVARHATFPISWATGKGCAVPGVGVLGLPSSVYGLMCSRAVQ